MNVNEIRVNEHYSTYSIAKYAKSKDLESTPIINKRIMRTDELLSKIKGNIPTNQSYKVSHLFPPNCRYYEQHKQGFLVVIEEPPAFRTIAVDKDMSNELASLESSGRLEEYGYENWKKENNTKPHMFNLAMPYVVFMFGFTSQYDVLGGYVFFRTQPISGFSDILCKAPFLNISDAQTVCFGDRIYKGPKRSIFADTSYAISTFWSTRFNPDYIYNYVGYQGIAGVCDYLTWQYYSHVDPMFIYKIDWIKCNEFNVGQTIERIRKWIYQRDDRDQEFGFQSLESLFIKQTPKGVEKVPGINALEPLIYDVTQYIFLGDVVCHVGDSFKINNGKTVFIDSFLGFRRIPEPSFINIEREDGRVFKMRLTRKVKAYLKVKIQEERFEMQAKIANGSVLKIGDILIMKNKYNQDVYRKIHYIRKAVDGKIEGRFGSEFYILENLSDDCSVMDLSEPDYMGIKLKTDKEYFVLRGNHYPAGPILSMAYCKFSEITTGSRSNLVVKLVEIQGSNKGHRYEVNLSNHNDQRIFSKEDARELPEIFRLGRNIVYPRDSSVRNSLGKAYVIQHLGIATPYGTRIRNADYSRYKDKLIKDNKFFLAGWDMDIEFQIGDKVVVVNWDDPLDMLTVKQIEGFVKNDQTQTIIFVMKDKNDKLYEYEYANSSYEIRVGTIRKITNNWEKLSAGMKITANTSGISMFPKKDTNIIIGFLYDTGGPEPLVLCSNACTLWYSDVIEKFDITPMRHKKKWRELQHAPINPSKMRIQAGDIINGKSNFTVEGGYFAYKPRDSRTIRAQQIRQFATYSEAYTFDGQFSRDMIFDSFPNPRLTTMQENVIGFVNAFPNFHGMYTETGRFYSPYLFTNDSRSILNVSNNSE